jgi:hypothetical protein
MLTIALVACLATVDQPPIEALPTPAEQVQALVDGKIKYEELSQDLQDAVAAVHRIKSADRTGRLAAIMLALAAIFKMLLSLAKTAASMGIWSKFQGGVIRLVTVCLGVAVFCTSSIAGGLPWWEALMLSFSGPGALVLHEYSSLVGIKKKKEHV